MVDVWKEVLQGAMADPELRANYSIPRMFEFTAELAGARNIEGMRLQVQPQSDISAALQAGNLALPPSLGNTPGVVPNPGRRLAGALAA